MKETPETSVEHDVGHRPVDGPDLRATREARGLSLADVHHRTRISITNLEALENLRFQDLPSPVYTRGFIKLYSRTLGIDAAPLLDRYRQHLDAAGVAGPIRTPTALPRKRITQGAYKVMAWSVSLILVAAVLFFALSAERRVADPSQKTGGKVLSRAAEGTHPAVGTDPGKHLPSLGIINPVGPPGEASRPGAPPSGDRTASVGMAGPTPLAAQLSAREDRTHAGKDKGAPYRLAMEARELTWIRVTQDEQPPYQLLLNPGDKVERIASRQFILDIGNAGGVSVVFQGRSLGELGGKGEVVHLRLPAAP